MQGLTIALSCLLTLACLASAGCGRSTSPGAANPALEIPDVPPAGPDMKKGPLDPRTDTHLPPPVGTRSNR
jgi:hypothetical protein